MTPGRIALSEPLLVAGFLKQGKASCGVSRQYTGSAGKVTNCQIGVFACYVSGHGHAFIDRELYLPKRWTDDKARMAKAHVPQETDQSRQWRLRHQAALALAIAANVPFSFVAADTVYGVGGIEIALRRAGKGYVLGAKSNDTLNSWVKPNAVAGTAKEIADRLPLSAWRRLSAGSGTKGERLHDWAYLELADLAGGECDEALAGQIWTRGLLIRRKIVDGYLAYFTTWAPSGTTIEALAKIEGHRWAIEDSFETAENELGLDHNETRSWHGWRRHVSLVMLAFAMMAVIRVHVDGPAAPSPKKIRRTMTTKVARPSWTANRPVGRCRKFNASPRVSHENEFVARLSSHGRYGEEPIKPKHARHLSKSNCNVSVGLERCCIGRIGCDSKVAV